MTHDDSLALSSRTQASPHSSHRLSLSLLPTRHPERPTRDSSTCTLEKRPWRRYTTPFPSILAYHYPGEGTEEEPYLIDWLPPAKGEGGVVVDRENPLSWPKMYKWCIMVLVAVATLAVAMASSAMSAAEHSVMQSFPGYTREVYTLGPLLWAPAGEVSGRRTLYVFTFLLFTIFNGALCGSQSVEALIVLRFFAGTAGASPLTNAGETVADLFSAEERGLGMVIFSTAPFLGPALGPICGGFLGETAGWRWVGALLAIFSAVLTVFGYLFLPETYPIVLLRRRAKLLSRVTGKRYIYKGDKGQDLRIKVLYKRALSRPWLLLFKEPIVFLLAI
ncbi:hypothetical protein QFC21_007089 [Naganishia friedmannii]|uniref:Uncharacterized protein n=1 Tax=Naganishia friedmannii TaxID=89922 RepID=A0ACC2UYU2_9TREE|nr:hypothetical protein QFC21_007089 [Naganishia friedmannii]